MKKTEKDIFEKILKYVQKKQNAADTCTGVKHWVAIETIEKIVNEVYDVINGLKEKVLLREIKLETLGSITTLWFGIEMIESTEKEVIAAIKFLAEEKVLIETRYRNGTKIYKVLVNANDDKENIEFNT